MQNCNRKINLALLALIAAGLLGGCVSREKWLAEWEANFVAEMNKIIQTWKGMTVRETLTQWGPPDRETSDEAGGRIFVYTHFSSSGGARGSSQIIGDKLYHDYSGPLKWQMKRMLWINPDGIPTKVGFTGQVFEDE